MYDSSDSKFGSAFPIFVCTNMYPSPGDPSRGVFVERTVAALQRRGFRTRTVAINRRLPLPIAYLAFWGRSFVHALANPEALFYIHFANLSAPGVLAAKLLRPRIRILVNVHGGDLFPETSDHPLLVRVKRRLSQWTLTKAHGIVAPSGAFARRMTRSYVVTAPVTVYPSGGVDSSVFRFDQEAEGRRTLFVFCGRMIEGKGVLDAAAAFARIQPEAARRGFGCLFIGDGPEVSRLRSRYADHFGSGYFSQTGFLNQEGLAAAFQKCAALVFPSTRAGESLGLVPIEAGFCGAQVFARGDEHAENLIPESLRGLFSFSDDVDLSSKLLDYITLDERARREYRTEAARWLAERYEARMCDERLRTVVSELFSAEPKK